MAKLNWNSFLKKYHNPHCFLSAVSASLPKGPNFDKNGKKLPTPYSLFVEWAETSLSGDWTSTTVQGGFSICVEAAADANLIANKFGVSGTPTSSAVSENTLKLGYRDGNYADLAVSLGYRLN